MPTLWTKIKRWFRPALPDNQQWVDQTPDGKLYEDLMENGCVECHRLPIKFFEGPSGGMSTNIFCGYCGQGYNVTPIIGIAQKIKKDDRYIEKEKAKG